MPQDQNPPPLRPCCELARLMAMEASGWFLIVPLLRRYARHKYGLTTVAFSLTFSVPTIAHHEPIPPPEEPPL